MAALLISSAGLFEIIIVDGRMHVSQNRSIGNGLWTSSFMNCGEHSEIHGGKLLYVVHSTDFW